MLDRRECLRSRSPRGVEQEVWGLLLAYNLIRLEMERVAHVFGVEPVELSFAGMLMLLAQLWQVLPLGPAQILSKLIASWEAQMQRLLLPARRPGRTYPRAVKVKMSNSVRKRPVSVDGMA